MTHGRRQYLTKPRRRFIETYNANPTPRGCRICGDEVYIRHLCRSDYEWAKRHKILDYFPADKERQRFRPLICVCMEPDAEELKWFGAWQCRRCYKPLIGRTA